MLRDAEGDEYLDFLSGIAVNNVGHCHPLVVAAIREQAARLIHVSNLFTTEPNVRLAERLASRSFGGIVFFCNSGAEANEAAIKLVRKAPPARRDRGRARRVPRADVRGTERDAAGVQAGAVRAAGARVPRRAADAEASSGAVGDGHGGGADRADPGRVGRERARRRRAAAPRARPATRVGAALVFDEVQTGMGRTGSLWAYEQLGVVPDAMTLAKGLGGGLPIGALVIGPRLADVFAPGDHGSTFAGGPLAAAAAHAALDVIDDEALLGLGARARRAADARAAALPGVSRCAGAG